jgi:DNA-binding NtrC family response regulator
MDLTWLIAIPAAGIAAPALWALGRDRWEWHRRRRVRILVVNDLERHLDLAGQALRDHGYQVHTCHQRMVPAVIRGGRYHVVLSGLALPGLDAPRLMTVVRGAASGTSVMLIGDPSDPLAAQALERGAVAVLPRRVDPEALLRYMDRLTRPASAQSATGAALRAG